MFLQKRLRKYPVVFVDYFDTTVFRFIHPEQVLDQWGKLIRKKIPELKFNDKEMILLRYRAQQNLRKKCDEPSYRNLIKELFDLCGLVSSKMIFDEFYSICYSIDLGIELGAQYRNDEIDNMLVKLKKEGKKIYLVSDFYLPREAYELFLKAQDIDNLFDDIYISSECDATKTSGALYKYVLNDLNIVPSNVAMVGDSKRDDVLQAGKNGIAGFRYLPLCHKIHSKLSNKFKFDFSKKIVQKKSRYLYEKTIFEEYVVPLYAVMQKLYTSAKCCGADKLAFLSRGGYFLKILFDEYQEYNFCAKDRLKSMYCLNSRKVCMAAQKNDHAKELLLKYLKDFESDGKLFLVDEGWYHRSQQNIARCSGWDTYGFYIGSRCKEPLDFANQCVRKGLLFDMGNKKPNTKYYGILCTNCSMYEQILTASHGSVEAYYEEDGVVKVAFKPNDKEMYLYDKYICRMQEKMLLHFRGLCAWRETREISLKECAQIVLRSVIFASKRRCSFLNDLDKNRFDNCTNGSLNDVKNIKNAMINPLQLLVHPDLYVGMFCKIQRKLVSRPILSIAYYPIAFTFYWYVRFWTRI